jgi:hypothetical protein
VAPAAPGKMNIKNMKDAGLALDAKDITTLTIPSLKDAL